MKVAIVTAPTIEPITVEELLLHLRIDDDTGAETDLFEAHIKTAREKVEEMTGRALLTQTWDYYLDAWPDVDYIKLPFGKLASVTSVKWKGTTGTETTLTATTDYLVETNGEGCGRIVLPYDTDWPTGTLYPSNPITIRFVCGWTTAASLPSKIKTAVKMICSDLYENREPSAENERVINEVRSYTLWDEF